MINGAPSADSRSRSSNAGIFWMLLTMFLFVSGDTIAKYLIQNYNTIQIVWGRYFFHSAILLIVLAPRLRTLLVTRNLKLQLARSLLLLGVVAGSGHFTLIKAYTVSPVATVAPFTYSNLPWAFSGHWLL